MVAFTEPHLDGVVTLCAAAGWPTYPADPAAALAALTAPGAVTVVETGAGGRVVGFAHGVADGSTGYLAQLLVTPEHRRAGVGRRLVVEFARRGRVERIDLLSDPAADNGDFWSTFAHRRFPGFRIYPGRAAPLAGFPTLRGDGVVLRPFDGTDIDVVLAACRDPFIPLITSVPAGGDRAAAHAWIDLQAARLRRGWGHSFAIADAASGRAVGQIGLWTHRVGPDRATIGYWVAREHRRRGYVGRALATIAHWALVDRELPRVELYVEPWNEGSWRAAERAGFRREGLLRGWERVGGELKDMYM